MAVYNGRELDKDNIKKAEPPGNAIGTEPPESAIGGVTAVDSATLAKLVTMSAPSWEVEEGYTEANVPGKPFVLYNGMSVPITHIGWDAAMMSCTFGVVGNDQGTTTVQNVLPGGTYEHILAPDTGKAPGIYHHMGVLICYYTDADGKEQNSQVSATATLVVKAKPELRLTAPSWTVEEGYTAADAPPQDFVLRNSLGTVVTVTEVTATGSATSAVSAGSGGSDGEIGAVDTGAPPFEMAACENGADCESKAFSLTPVGGKPAGTYKTVLRVQYIVGGTGGQTHTKPQTISTTATMVVRKKWERDEDSKPKPGTGITPGKVAGVVAGAVLLVGTVFGASRCNVWQSTQPPPAQVEQGAEQETEQEAGQQVEREVVQPPIETEEETGGTGITVTAEDEVPVLTAEVAEIGLNSAGFSLTLTGTADAPVTVNALLVPGEPISSVELASPPERTVAQDTFTWQGGEAGQAWGATGLLESVTYTAYFQATDADGDVSDVVTVTFITLGRPTVSAGAAATTTTATITLRTNTHCTVNMALYKGLRWINANNYTFPGDSIGGQRQFQSVFPNCSTEYTDLLPGTDYTAIFYGVNSDGINSPMGAVSFKTTALPPPAPLPIQEQPTGGDTPPGPTMVAVPGFIAGETDGNAYKSTLDSLGFAVSIVEEDGGYVVAGRVIRIDPAAATLPKGASITIYVQS